MIYARGPGANRHTSGVVRIEQSLALAAAAEAVWTRAVTEEGINDELSPIRRMTMPPGLRDKTVDTVEVGAPLGRSGPTAQAQSTTLNLSFAGVASKF